MKEGGSKRCGKGRKEEEGKRTIVIRTGWGVSFLHSWIETLVLLMFQKALSPGVLPFQEQGKEHNLKSILVLSLCIVKEVTLLLYKMIYSNSFGPSNNYAYGCVPINVCVWVRSIDRHPVWFIYLYPFIYLLYMLCSLVIHRLRGCCSCKLFLSFKDTGCWWCIAS